MASLSLPLSCIYLWSFWFVRCSRLSRWPLCCLESKSFCPPQSGPAKAPPRYIWAPSSLFLLSCVQQTRLWHWWTDPGFKDLTQSRDKDPEPISVHTAWRRAPGRENAPNILKEAKGPSFSPLCWFFQVHRSEVVKDTCEVVSLPSPLGASWRGNSLLIPESWYGMPVWVCIGLVLKEACQDVEEGETGRGVWAAGRMVVKWRE